MRRSCAQFHSQYGQLLVETMLALAVLIIGFLGIVTLLARSLGISRVVSENYIASSLATEGIEVVKNMIDTNVLNPIAAWNEGLHLGFYEVAYDSEALEPLQNRFLLFDPATHLYSYKGSQRTPFRRTIQITYPVSNDEMVVTSVVRWKTRGGGTFEVALEDHFYNWR